MTGMKILFLSALLATAALSGCAIVPAEPVGVYAAPPPPVVVVRPYGYYGYGYYGGYYGGGRYWRHWR